jgi:hypothetical protein
MKTLVKEHGFFDATRNAGTNTWTLTDGFNYRLIPGTTGVGSLYAYSRTFFDLAGLSMDEKTLFFDMAAVQTGGLPVFSGPASPGDSISIIDVMTSVPLTEDATMLSDLAYGFGFNGSRQNFEHVIFARHLQYAVHLDLGSYASPTLTASNQYGSGEATASDRVYSYRFILLGTAVASGVTGSTIVGARHVLTATPKEEQEYQYLMRLKRSYDLQQAPDVD